MLPGLADHVLLQLLGEVGTDLGKHWQTGKHFTAWLGLAPGSKQSGKRRGSQRRSRNRAGRLFCVVGRSVDRALARKLAELFWRLMVHGQDYVGEGLKKYEIKVAETEASWLRKLARNHGLVLLPTPS